jgi:allantoate deiminase
VNGSRILARCDELARHSQQSGALTRMFLTLQHRAVCDLAAGWRREAGMEARLDAIGNVVGRFEGDRPGLPCLMLGSHLDTVRDAGRYDGMLGVVTAIECVAALAARGRRLSFAIEVIGFGDEEGVRFGTTLLGSRAVAGTLDEKTLEVRDAEGVSLADALRQFGLDPARIGDAVRRREEVLSYVELHIEQGPVLEAEGLPVGVVTAINGFSRLAVTLEGIAGHAGTVPMGLRRDALAAAAECVVAVEARGRAVPETVATVGRIEALPGAINVIPGKVHFTLDVRSPRDADRIAAVTDITRSVREIAGRRGIAAAIGQTLEHRSTPCSPGLIERIAAAIADEGLPVRHLPSGAGHDGMAMAAITAIGMIFVRCRDGVSHNPAEAIIAADAETGARVLLRFIEAFAR